MTPAENKFILGLFVFTPPVDVSTGSIWSTLESSGAGSGFELVTGVVETA